MGYYRFFRQIGVTTGGKPVFENMRTHEISVEEDYQYLRELQDGETVIAGAAEARRAYRD
jgi:hypothetical protein